MKRSGATAVDLVVPTCRDSESYLQTGFMKILKKAGNTPWPKIFENMRASRETELLDEFPTKDVCAWIGNKKAVAMKHYSMRREDSFSRAAGFSTKNGGHNGGHKACQVQATDGNSQSDEKSTEVPFEPEKLGKKNVRQLKTTWGKIQQRMGDTGFEPATSTMSTQDFQLLQST